MIIVCAIAWGILSNVKVNENIEAVARTNKTTPDTTPTTTPKTTPKLKKKELPKDKDNDKEKNKNKNKYNPDDAQLDLGLLNTKLFQESSIV